MLYAYQKRWLQSQSRFKIAMFARQTGKTFITTLDLVLSCIAAETHGRRERWVILSRGERQAKESMDTGVKLHCRAMALAFHAADYDWQCGENMYKVSEVTLPGGSRILALPANPDTARGFSANVFLDEFAFHHDSRKIWAALFPVISAGHRLIITSTPNGKRNKFYEIMSGEGALWDRHTVDIYQAIADGLPRDLEALREGAGDDEVWQQEFELKWLDGASAWLDYDLINSVESEAAGDPANYTGGYCYLGNDIAARHHLWVAWVFEAVGDVMWTREIVERQRVTFAEQDAVLDTLVERYKVVRLCMDQSGMGEKPVEDAKRRYGESRVEGVLFTQHSKLHLANVAKQSFEAGKLRIPAGHAKLRADLHSLKKVTTPTGGVRFDVESADNSHADRTWACFLGLYAAAQPAALYRYEAVENHSTHPMHRPVVATAGFKSHKGAW
jgi:phage FluMu gp28-like protein